MASWVRFNDTSNRWELSTNGGSSWGELPLGIRLIDGSAGTPSLAFDQDPDTGLYRPTTNAIGLVTGGTERWRLNANGIFFPSADNSYDVGGASNRLRYLYIAGRIIGEVENHGACFVDPNGISTAPANVMPFFRCPYPGTITAALGRIPNGTSATVNVYNSGAAAYIRATDLSLTPSAWTSFGTLQNTTVAAGTYLYFRIGSVAGTPEHVSVTIDITRT